MTQFTILVHHILSPMGWEYIKTAIAPLIALPHIIFSLLELCHAGTHNKYESFDVWFQANGPELIELDEILEIFVQPSNLFP